MAPTTRAVPAVESPSTVLLDAHVHCHPSFDLGTFLGNAQRNLIAAAENLGAPHDTAGLLVLTEGIDEDAFARFRHSQSRPPPGWIVESTNETVSLVACRGPRMPIVLVAGQQIALHDGLEMLSLGAQLAVETGRDLQATMIAIIDSGGLPVLPWGFGKWWLGRGRLVDRLLESSRFDQLLLADSGTRAALLPYPRRLSRAGCKGFRVVAGSDPLPLPGEIERPGSFGVLLAGRFSIDRPAAALRDLLAESTPRPFGRGRPLIGFVKDQLAMQLRKMRS